MMEIKAADGLRLERLLHRVTLLQSYHVTFQPDQIRALRKVVNILLTDVRKAERARNKDGPPPGFGTDEST